MNTHDLSARTEVTVSAPRHAESLQATAGKDSCLLEEPSNAQINGLAHRRQSGASLLDEASPRDELWAHPSLPVMVKPNWPLIYRYALSRLSWCACAAAPEASRLQYIEALTAGAAGLARGRPLVYLDVGSGLGKQLVMQVASLMNAHPALVIKSIEKNYQREECGGWEVRAGQVTNQGGSPPAGTVKDMLVACKALSAMHPGSLLLLQTDCGLASFRAATAQKVNRFKTPPHQSFFFRALSMPPDVISLIDRGPLTLHAERTDTNVLFNQDPAIATQAVIFDGDCFAIVQNHPQKAKGVVRFWPLAADKHASFCSNLQTAASQLGMQDPVRGTSGEVTLWGLKNLYPQAQIYASWGDALLKHGPDTPDADGFHLQDWLEDLPQAFHRMHPRHTAPSTRHSDDASAP